MKSVEAQIEVNESQIASAQATVKQREALLKQAQVDLERTIIRAPVNGTVILKNIDAGQTVAASLQAPVLFTIAQDLRDMQVEAAIDEADVGRLRVGQRANFTVDAFPRRNFDGRNPADPQIAGQRAERDQLHGGDLGRQPGPVAAAGHDRERARGGGQPRQRAQGRQRRAALPARRRRRGAGDGKAAGDGQAAQQGGGNPAQQFRQRVFEELKPDETQKAKLEQIFDDVRQKMMQLRDMPKDGDRRKAGERLRAESRDARDGHPHRCAEAGLRAAAGRTGRRAAPARPPPAASGCPARTASPRRSR